MTSIAPHANWSILALLASSLLLAGCSSIGPGTVSRDRFNYRTP
jgi:hypothetical protein